MCMLLSYFLHTLSHLIHCIILIYGSIMHSLDCIHAEPESKDLEEQAAAEDPTNPELAQGKPRCIRQVSLLFTLNHNFILRLFVHYKLS
jgi:hypothetical protein